MRVQFSRVKVMQIMSLLLLFGNPIYRVVEKQFENPVCIVNIVTNNLWQRVKYFFSTRYMYPVE